MVNEHAAKIDSLFEERNIAGGLDKGVVSSEIYRDSLRRVKEIQTLVYRIDHHFETASAVNRCLLEEHWSVLRRLVESTVSGSDRCLGLVDNIRTYQDIEERLREGGTLCIRRIPWVLYYKSADVSLARACLRALLDIEWSRKEAEIWRLIDAAREAIDDWCDIDEDRHDYNVNLFWNAQKQGRCQEYNLVDIFSGARQCLAEAEHRLQQSTVSRCSPVAAHLESTIRHIGIVGDRVSPAWLDGPVLCYPDFAGRVSFGSSDRVGIMRGGRQCERVEMRFVGQK